MLERTKDSRFSVRKRAIQEHVTWIVRPRQSFAASVRPGGWCDQPLQREQSTTLPHDTTLRRGCNKQVRVSWSLFPSAQGSTLRFEAKSELDERFSSNVTAKPKSSRKGRLAARSSFGAPFNRPHTGVKRKQKPEECWNERFAYPRVGYHWLEVAIMVLPSRWPTLNSHSYIFEQSAHRRL